MLKQLPSIIIILLVLIILIQRCKSGNNTPVNINIHDTTTSIKYVYVKDSGHSKPIYIKGGRDTILENTIEYVPSEEYSDLLEQFNDLKIALLSKNIYKDEIPIDTFGNIKITDTIQRNMVVGRGWTTDIKVPEKTITITNNIYPKPKRQLYIGGGIFLSQNEPVRQINIGLLLKNKKDQIYSVSAGIDLKGTPEFGIHSYWKIKIK
jgi:hypothetical protein